MEERSEVSKEQGRERNGESERIEVKKCKEV